jgi:hypothetical protein
MCGYFLRNDKGEYVKSLDTENHVLEFTTDANEAKNYTNGSWFAETELDFLRFHFKEFKDTLDTMYCKYEEH